MRIAVPKIYHMKTKNKIGFKLHVDYLFSKTPKLMLALGAALLAAAGILYFLRNDPAAGPWIKWMVPCMVAGAALTAFTKKLTPSEVKETAIEKIAENMSTALDAAKEEKIQDVVTKAVDNIADKTTPTP